jgi:hypothetical protein
MRPDATHALIARYPPGVQDIIARARALLVASLPGIEETVDEPARLLGYGYGPGYKGMIATLIPSKTEVKLGLFRGSELPDPDGLLQGSGKVHRHVRLRSAADIEQPALARLLKAALAAFRER